ncbi:MAG: TetR/AcrR family transcriptional regulator [Lachnospiraceae bacterium]|nr:TetR/AcrR family transcriptional regulator [Lachnospiraceae bacterium]
MGYDYDQTHNRILKSAMEQFIQKGFSGASIREICKNAGVTNGAFYAHFESKEDMFSALVEPVLKGMQELYNQENLYYMDIKTAADVKKVMKQTFSSNRLIVHYIFENIDVFKLLLMSGKGTRYEGLIDSLATEEADNTMKFIDICKPYVSGGDRISEELVKLTSRFIISSLYDGVISGKSEQEVIHETELASEFCLAGMKHFLGIK